MMYKLNKTVKPLTIMILLIALIVSGCSNNNESANEPIQDTTNEPTTESSDMYEVFFPGYDSIESLELDSENGKNTLELVKDKEEELLGVVAYVSPNGYGGPIKIKVSIDNNGVILGSEVLEHEESPGLGDGVEEESFRQQFVGKGINDTFEIDLDIDAISSATFSTKAFIEGIKESLSMVAPYID